MSNSSDPPASADLVAERWRRWPVTREAVVRICDETSKGRFDLAPTVQLHREALYFTLAELSAQLIDYGAKPGWVTPAQARRVGRTLQAFRAAVDACSETREPPPGMPQALVGEIERWVETHSTSMFGPGRQPSAFAIKVYPSLLAFYALAFGLKPSATGGPTHRFVQGFFTEVRRSLGGMSRHWAVPSTEALKSRLRPFLAATSRGVADREVGGIFARIKAELSKGGGGK